MSHLFSNNVFDVKVGVRQLVELSDGLRDIVQGGKLVVLSMQRHDACLPVGRGRRPLGRACWRPPCCRKSNYGLAIEVNAAFAVKSVCVYTKQMALIALQNDDTGHGRSFNMPIVPRQEGLVNNLTCFLPRRKSQQGGMKRLIGV